jgi:hypothetical protein
MSGNRVLARLGTVIAVAALGAVLSATTASAAESVHSTSGDQPAPAGFFHGSTLAGPDPMGFTHGSVPIGFVPITARTAVPVGLGLSVGAISGFVPI